MNYLTFKAEALGYHPEMILAGRRINDGMGKYIAERTVKMLIAAGKQVRGARVAILGITFTLIFSKLIEYYKQYFLSISVERRVRVFGGFYLFVSKILSGIMKLIWLRKDCLAGCF